MTLFVLSLFIFYISLAVFADKRLLTYLHIFQQEEYDNSRFLPWLIRTRSVDTRATLALFTAALFPMFLIPATGLLFGAAALAVLSVKEVNPRKVGKKKLVLTPRASRIRFIAAFLAAVFYAAILWFWQGAWPWQAFLVVVAGIHLLPVWLTAANLALKPVEAYQYNKFWSAARTRFESINPTTIGVTGSYGKTSVKHLLAHVLQTAGKTYATKGSINTPMGVARAIREDMPNGTQYYVGEMGAYAIGSIGRMCSLTPPSYGIITALGEAHYERFKSLENVAKAKFELAEWVFKKNTTKPSMVVSEQILSQPYAKAFIERYHADFLIVGTGAESHVHINAIRQTAEGTVVKLTYKNKPVTLSAPVWGEHHGHNMALVFGMAMVLGLAPEQVVMALGSAPQITHRLEVKPQAGGITYIDDAYNSNPTGFASALQTLTLLKTDKKGRRILVTPGMVELGEKHDAEHTRLGSLAAENADIILVVSPSRIPTFVEAVAALGNHVHLMPSFTEARTWLTLHQKPGDVILLENDLPDLLERKLTL